MWVGDWPFAVSIVFDEEAEALLSDVVDVLNYFSLTALNTIELLKRAACKALIFVAAR
jgi:hypothetical protein